MTAGELKNVLDVVHPDTEIIVLVPVHGDTIHDREIQQVTVRLSTSGPSFVSLRLAPA